MGFGKFDKEEPQVDAYGHLMCIAHNCPNRWSVDAGNGRLCSRHAWVDSSKWGQVTRDMAAETSYGQSSQDVRQYSQDEKLEILRKLEKVGLPSDPRLWAKALQERENRGERLSSFQKSAWREALGVRE